MTDPNLAFQFSGPYVQALVSAIQTEIDKRNFIILYFEALTIQNANADQLANLGYIVGYPWPNGPTGIFNDNNFTYDTYTLFPEINPLISFGSLDGTVGGLLSSTTPAVGNLIPIQTYRNLLTQVAYMKYNGMSLASIDKICKVFGSSYTINSAGAYNSDFIFGDAALAPQVDAAQGFSNGNAGLVGGELSSMTPGVLPDSDIKITFQTYIGTGNLYIIQQVFNRFTTAPQISVIQG